MSLNIHVGSSGKFTLIAPFNAIIGTNVRYVCKSVRKLSDLIAENEDPLNDIYIKNGLTEEDYQNAVAVDESIIALQSAKGHWVKVPANYVASYASGNGVPYLKLALNFALPPLPLNTDFDSVCVEISQLIRDRLGIDCNYRKAALSKVVYVDKDNHDTHTVLRNNVKTNLPTDRARVVALQNREAELLAVIDGLKQYIEANSL